MLQAQAQRQPGQRQDQQRGERKVEDRASPCRARRRGARPRLQPSLSGGRLPAFLLSTSLPSPSRKRRRATRAVWRGSWLTHSRRRRAAPVVVEHGLDARCCPRRGAGGFVEQQHRRPCISVRSIPGAGARPWSSAPPASRARPAGGPRVSSQAGVQPAGKCSPTVSAHHWPSAITSATRRRQAGARHGRARAPSSRASPACRVEIGDRAQQQGTCRCPRRRGCRHILPAATSRSTGPMWRAELVQGEGGHERMFACPAGFQWVARRARQARSDWARM